MNKLFGHDEQMRRLSFLHKEKKLPNSILLSGAKGIGKATFAKHLAAFILDADAAASLRMESGAHSDFMLVKPPYDEKNEEQKREINVEQAREISKFLSFTPAESQSRVVLIDSGDELNQNAANSILKTLEEPPIHAFIIIVSHNSASLMPTIRSRCQKFTLSPISKSEFRELMIEIAPEISPDEIDILSELSSCSPGVSLNYHKLNAVKYYEEIQEIMKTAPDFDAIRLHKMADSISNKARHSNFQVLKEVLLGVMASKAKHSLGISQWSNIWFEANEHFSLAERAHLDYKTALISWFDKMRSAKLA